MHILVTGSKGQLGSELKELAPAYQEHRFFFTDREELDVRDGEAIYKYMKANKIKCLINATGYTAVDQAEEHPDHAQQLNAMAVGRMAEAAARLDALIVHISTDYVFDGKLSRPYTENDTASPRTSYGKSKLNGELEILFNAKRALIIRTSWLYSKYGNNFVKAILKTAMEKQEVKVVFDQIGSPTWARDLAATIMELIPGLPVRMRTEIYNYSNEGVASWFDFARAIADIKELDCRVIPVHSSEMKSLAVRPPFSVLDKSRIKKDFGIQIPYWRDSLARCLESM
jgi:dTDP-4-dehydrorhamnose reductase